MAATLKRSIDQIKENVEEDDSESEMSEEDEDGDDELFQENSDDEYRDSYEESDKEEEEEEESKQGLEAMGDVITKILKKKVKSDPSSIVLSKSKSTKQKQSDVKEDVKSKKAKYDLLADQREMNHILPIEVNNVPKEARLRRIGTKGVVMLFNAVSKHQKEKADKMKTAKTEGDKIKVEKSMKKSSFMDMLKKGDNKSSGKVKNEKVAEDKNGDSAEPTWDVLKNDFMLGSTLKHWDREEEEKNPKKKKKNVKETLEVESSDDEAGSNNSS